MRTNVYTFDFAKRLFTGAGAEFSKDNALRLSAALSYYSLFSLAPLLLIAIGIVGRIYGADAVQGKIETQLTSVMGWPAAHALQSIVESASKTSGGATFLGFLTLFVGASGVFGQLKGALDSIWEVRPKPGLGVMGFIREQLLSFGMVLVIGFLLLISLVMATVVAAFSSWVEAHLGLPKVVSAIFGFVLPLVVETVLFAMIFKVLPSAEVEWRNVWIGAAFTAVLFELGKLGLSFYLARASTTSSFGAAGSVVVLLLWVYYGSTILFFGAEITEVYARLMGSSIQPAQNAESTEATPAQTALKTPAVPAPIPAEPHLNATGPTPRAPRHETLVPLIARGLLPHPERARRAAEEAALSRTFAGKLKLWKRRADENPLGELAVALGVGLAAGIASRLLEKTGKTALTPTEHFQAGAKQVAKRGQSWASELAEEAAEAWAKVRG